MDYTIVTIVVVTSRGRGFGDSALGEGVPDRVQRYPVFIWGPSEPRSQVCLV